LAEKNEGMSYKGQGRSLLNAEKKKRERIKTIQEKVARIKENSNEEKRETHRSH